MVPGFPYVNRGNWGWECDSLCYYVLSFRKQHNLQNAVFCEDHNCKYSCLIGSSHIQNDVEHFQNGLVPELYSLKVSQMCKVHTSSHERTNMWLQTTKIPAKLCQPIWQRTMILRRTPHLLKKSRMFVNTTLKVLQIG